MIYELNFAHVYDVCTITDITEVEKFHIHSSKLQENYVYSVGVNLSIFYRKMRCMRAVTGVNIDMVIDEIVR